MITPPITIYEGRVTIHYAAGAVWMTQHEIADLFGVFVSAVGANIRSILRNEILREERVRREIRHSNGGTTTLYNLEMITALAFRLKSRRAELFRRWIVEKAVTPVTLLIIPNTEAIPN